MSIPGIGFVSASVILSEIENYRDFQTPDQLAKWCGLNPGENETAGKKKKCGITKRGSKHIRVVLVQAAQTISNMNKTALSRFFQRLIKKKERNVVIVAVARKLIGRIYHLLINQELYQEGECRKRGSSQDKSSAHAPSFMEEHLTDRVAAIVDAFYHLKESSRKNALMREMGAISMTKPGKKRPFPWEKPRGRRGDQRVWYLNKSHFSNRQRKSIFWLTNSIFLATTIEVKG